MNDRSAQTLGLTPSNRDSSARPWRRADGNQPSGDAKVDAPSPAALETIPRLTLIAAVWLVATPTAILMLASAGLAIGQPIAGCYVPVGAAATALLLVSSEARRAGRGMAIGAASAIGVASVLVGAALLLGSRWYDTTYDGLAYHQSAIVALVRGWNPFHSSAPPIDHALGKDLLDQIEHFSKGPWFIEAAIAKCFGQLEIAKGLNIVLGLAAGLAGFAALSALGLGRLVGALLSICLALNPVVTCQSLGFCLDGQLASAFTALLAFGFLAMEDGHLLSLAGAASATVLLVDSKLTGVPYAVVLWGVIGTAALIRQGWKRTAALAVVGGLACALGFGFTGYNPYVTNTIREGHPFHPAAGPHARDFVAHSRPPRFAEMNRFERLAWSIFSASSTDEPDGRPRLKIPFTIVGDEATKFHDPEVKTSGFGPLFSGSLLAAILLVALSWRSRGGISSAAIGAALLGSVLLTAEGWWARIAPQLWLVPFVFLLPGLQSGRKLLRAAAIAVALFLTVNVGVIAINYFNRNRWEQAAVRQELADLRRASERVIVHALRDLLMPPEAAMEAGGPATPLHTPSSGSRAHDVAAA